MLCEQTQTIPVLVVQSPFQRLRRQIVSFFDTNASPETTARSFALGTLISVLPTPGFNIALAALLAARYKQLNKAALLAAVGVWNGFVVAPLYALSYQLGEMLFGTMPGGFGVVSFPVALLSLVKGFLVGNVLIALLVTAVSYLVVKTAVSQMRGSL
ncbi:MAG: DUF2062 domain-containing protein [Anaerolineales bacterium]|nr:DUF2062 domain-containing protein [Anaerolineales bacterium]MCA9927703.1 DUF2062 domain-containing protein [Anaerolineales bacterium]